MSHETATRVTDPEETAPQLDQDFIPLDFTPEQQHVSPTGDLAVRAALRVNGLFEQNNKARHDAVDWTKNTAEQAKERTKSVFKRIGRGAIRGAKAGLKAAAYVPLVAVGAGIMVGEAGASAVKSGATAATEGARRQFESGKDMVANSHDRAKIGLGKLSLSNIETELRFENNVVEEATRKRVKSEAVEQTAIEKRNEVLIARNECIKKADAGRARIAARQAKKDSHEYLVSEADAA